MRFAPWARRKASPTVVIGLSWTKFFESCPKATNEDKLAEPLAAWHKIIFEGFDPGSERTLAAWIRHASRTNPVPHPCPLPHPPAPLPSGEGCGERVEGGVRDRGSGERGSKAWVTYPGDRDSHPNGWVIPGDLSGRHLLFRKRISPRERLTWY